MPKRESHGDAVRGEVPIAHIQALAVHHLARMGRKVALRGHIFEGERPRLAESSRGAGAPKQEVCDRATHRLPAQAHIENGRHLVECRQLHRGTAHEDDHRTRVRLGHGAHHAVHLGRHSQVATVHPLGLVS